jgi:cephalosporin hydroxylase
LEREPGEPRRPSSPPAASERRVGAIPPGSRSFPKVGRLAASGAIWLTSHLHEHRSQGVIVTIIDLVDEANRRYYESRVWLDTYWLGVPTQKCPQDLWVYQEILVETRPDVIVETGTAAGGSALYLASICDLLDRGEVITIDILERTDALPRHPRITYMRGRSSVDPPLVADVREQVAGRRAMVILDSDHSREHVLAELHAYAPVVAEGCYLVVEDTNLNGHPVTAQSRPGPWEAVDGFLAETTDFEVDRSREKLMLTFNPRGYLRRLEDGLT